MKNHSDEEEDYKERNISPSIYERNPVSMQYIFDAFSGSEIIDVELMRDHIIWGE
jgi:hypothetical protein